MSWLEIAGRSRQEASKLIERSVARERSFDARTLLRRHAPSLASPSAALDVLRQSAPARFFAGVENPKWIAGLLPDHSRAVVSAAADVLQGRFNLLGYRTLWFGEPIDWHLDPVWSRRAPRRHWTTLNPLEPDSVGDSKVVWELNRHQWLVGVAQAYALTGDERYAEHCLTILESWIDENPPGFGINWSSSLEVAYRVMSWSWILLLVRNSAALSGDRLQRVLASLWIHANHVARYLSYYFSPNTHLTGEALGLFYAGTLFPEFTDARRWRRTGARVLIAESEKQTCPDGTHFERSACYHRYTVETYEQFLLLAARNGITVPADVSDRLRRMIEFVVTIRRPDGAIPDVGDADGGRLLPVVSREQGDQRGVLAVGAAMFQRPDLAWAAQGMAAEVPWLMGDVGVRRFDALEPHVPTGTASRLFASGGYAVMSSGWERDAHHMIVDVGPLGCSFSSGHGHADLLSVQCSAFGEPVLADAGTYCYTPEPEWRDHFRGTAAHSTVMIDGRSQVEPDGPFGWRSRAGVTVREWRSQRDCDFVDASHDAYPGLRHRRRVMFVKPHYWIVVDDVTPVGGPASAGSRDITLGFQFAPMRVTAVDDRWVQAHTPGGNSFWIGSFASSPARPDIRTGETSPIRGWVSAEYGQRTPAPMVMYSSPARIPWRSIALLLPRRGTASTVPIAVPLFDDHDLPIGIELEDRHEAVFVDDGDIYRSRDL
jgi:uncharacterized heparinase superfamily protein